jgi:hypothetical protein
VALETQDPDPVRLRDEETPLGTLPCDALPRLDEAFEVALRLRTSSRLGSPPCVTAPCPDKLADRSPYSASFIAALIVQKCEDGLPIYRMEKLFERLGIPMARSTMTDLFHRGAALLAPISARILARIAASEIVFADETSIKMQSSDKRAFVWTFLDDLHRLRLQPPRAAAACRSPCSGRARAS